ncbi:RES family NAD+ phosphorylase [Candidatus Spongiihabitans sp.]|uniref:RES family NAD+ phosphorylase n=1 Tax=Candidatus Spongiihabitans sp. TaxID=3101308 RepID=UPI003C7B787A
MIEPLSEQLADKWIWWRIAERHWKNPLDAGFAQTHGGRWNPPNSFATLYLNEDLAAARRNLRRFIAKWPYEPEDLRPDRAPVLVGASLPQRQTVCDAHTPTGLRALGLPQSYPVNAAGKLIVHARCQALGRQVKSLGLRGVLCRSAQSKHGTGRELAWFPATARSHAKHVKTLAFDDWYWGEKVARRAQQFARRSQP